MSISPLNWIRTRGLLAAKSRNITYNLYERHLKPLFVKVREIETRESDLRPQTAVLSS